MKERALKSIFPRAPMANNNLKKTVLVIDDDRVFCDGIKEYLASDSLDVLVSHTAAEGLAVCSRKETDVVLLDQKLPDAEGHTLCPSILKYNDQTKIIFATAYPSFDNAVKALKSGAHDYLSKPFKLAELGHAVESALRTRELERFEQIQNFRSERERDEAVIIGGSGLAETLDLVELAASSRSPVLITGETGTGKSLMAKAIHYRSSARRAPFIAINCTALPETLIEAELFGYEKGAFTGAVTTKKGIFEMAEGGTLLLDEIGDMPLHLQAKLLGVLEDKTVRRLGGESARSVNVRIITATGVDLESSLGKTFRKDLYYRLSVIRIHMPPLRDRRGDIPGLCSHLLKEIVGGREIKIEDAELAKLSSYAWPGNVRELKNILERAFILQKGPAFRPSELLGSVCEASQPAPSAGQNEQENISLADMEARHINYMLNKFSGNHTRAAQALGISRSTLKRKLKQLS
jgi:DNA-binding NtrC family response regulator